MNVRSNQHLSQERALWTFSSVEFCISVMLLFYCNTFTGIYCDVREPVVIFTLSFCNFKFFLNFFLNILHVKPWKLAQD